MTESDVVLDTWAWWEIFHDTRIGRALDARYLNSPSVRAHTSALTLGELAAKLTGSSQEGEIDRLTAAIRGGSQVHDVTAELAIQGGRLRGLLRRRSSDASLAEAIVLATARKVRGGILSADPAFSGLPEKVRLPRLA